MPSVDGVPPPSQVLAGQGLVAGQNALVASAQSLPFNNIGVGGIEVFGITAGLNVVGQIVKMHPKFDQNKWLVPLLLVLGLAICLVLWHDDIRKAVLNGFMAIDTAVKNYGALNQGGIMRAGTPTGKDS